jgi:hypothetical protein
MAIPLEKVENASYSVTVQVKTVKVSPVAKMTY